MGSKGKPPPNCVASLGTKTSRNSLAPRTRRKMREAGAESRCFCSRGKEEKIKGGTSRVGELMEQTFKIPPSCEKQQPLREKGRGGGRRKVANHAKPP